MIDLLEKEDLENFSSDQIEKIAYFFAILARKGIPQSEPTSLAILDQDINALLCEASRFKMHESFEAYSIEHAVSLTPVQALICKSWVSKQCHNVKKFVKKHKKAIAIGGAIAVGLAVGVGAIAALVGTSAASTIAAAAGSAAALVDSGFPERPSPNGSFSRPMEEVIHKSHS